MRKVRALQTAIDIHANFTPPILDWRAAPARFYALIHDALSQDIQMSALHFSERIGVSPGTSEAEYKVMGGQNNITLAADRLSARFPNLTSGNFEAELKVMAAVDSKFGRAFPDCHVQSIRCALNAHARIIDGSSVASFLDPYRNEKIDALLSGIEGACYGPSIKFSAQSQEWKLFCVAEQSELLADGLFLGLDINLRTIPASASFAHTLQRTTHLISLCAKALEVEWCDYE